MKNETGKSRGENNVNKKSLAREFCFQYFFHLQLPIFKELRERSLTSADESAFIESINEYKESTDTLLEKDLFKFVTTQIKNTLSHYEELEEKISGYLKNWKLSRLSKVDHTLLLLAFSELLYHKETPPKVVINEFIEISKKYGAKDSVNFINGVLDRFAKSEIL
ncbi:MAG: transcription antitermination factor NusB [Bacteriovoracaceae bacterium]